MSAVRLDIARIGPRGDGVATTAEGPVYVPLTLPGESVEVEREHDRGRLVSVLDDWDLPQLSVNIAFQSRRHMSAKVRTFIDFLVAHFDRMDYHRKWTAFDGVLPVASG